MFPFDALQTPLAKDGFSPSPTVPTALPRPKNALPSDRKPPDER
jgi:hypothetical protein